MRTTERFTIQRKKQLEKVFNETSLITIWRKIGVFLIFAESKEGLLS